MRTIRYRTIAEDLRGRVRRGEFARSGVLPSEAELSDHYDASRVTVRRALEVLRDEGLLDSRQGFGWILAGEPVRQDLDHLETLERRLAAAGVRSERRVLSFGSVPTPAQVRSSLEGARVLEARRLHLADGVPFARVTVWCPERLGGALSWNDVERSSFLDQLPVRLGGATQSIGAAAVGDDDAGLLDVPAGSPVLVAERVTRDEGGRAVLVSEHVFPAHRTRFVADLPVHDGSPPHGSLRPAGLHLVD